MADKPSRALVLYGDGMVPSIAPSHTHIHSMASLSSCGFLTLPHSPPSENLDARIVREFGELLDVNENVNSEVPNISDRFMGLKATLVTNNSNLQSFGSKFGLTILNLNEIIENSHSLHEPSLVAAALLKLLGFEEGKTLETSWFDLLLVHVGAGEEPNGLMDIEHINDLVGALIDIAKPGTEISSRLHLSLIMSYGAVCGDDNLNSSLSIAKHDNNSKLSLLYPHQSYTMKGGKLRYNVRHHSPMLIAQWQNAVTRKDLAAAYCFPDFKEHGSNLAIPADRFLHEVAFKLWKAPKYGA